MGGEPGKLLDSALGLVLIASAVRVVGTRVGRETMLAGQDFRSELLGQHRQHGLDPLLDPCESLHGEHKHRVESKQRLEVKLLPIVDVVTIQGQHSSLSNIEPRTEQNPELQREILCEYILCPSRGLDLDETPASFREPLNHVRSSKHAAVLERGFEEGRHRFVLNDPLSFFEGLCNLPVILRDQYSAGMAPAGQFPDFMPHIEDGL